MNTQENRKPTVKQWLTIGGIALALILAVVMILINKKGPKTEDWVPVIPGETTLSENNTVATLPGESHTPIGTEDAADPSAPTASVGQSSPTEGISGDTSPIPTLGDQEPYENWLASAMIIGISMQYSDFDFLGIYTASQTPVEAHDSSKGAYVVFTADGKSMALKSVPLTGERGDRGTSDLYVPAIGYATYDLIDPTAVPVASLTELTIESLEELIIASSQVSIIER